MHPWSQPSGLIPGQLKCIYVDNEVIHIVEKCATHSLHWKQPDQDVDINSRAPAGRCLPGGSWVSVCEEILSSPGPASPWTQCHCCHCWSPRPCVITNNQRLHDKGPGPVMNATQCVRGGGNKNICYILFSVFLQLTTDQECGRVLTAPPWVQCATMAVVGGSSQAQPSNLIRFRSLGGGQGCYVSLQKLQFIISRYRYPASSVHYPPSHHTLTQWHSAQQGPALHPLPWYWTAWSCPPNQHWISP